MVLLLFNFSVVSDSLQPHGLKLTGLPCPLPSPRVYSNLCPSSQWCYPTISSSVVPFSSCLQSFPASESFLIFSKAFHIRWSNYGSFSISPSNEYLGLASFKIDGFYLLTVQGTLRSLLQHHCSKASILQWSAFFMVQLSYLYMTNGKTTALTRWTFASKVMSLLLICCLGWP